MAIWFLHATSINQRTLTLWILLLLNCSCNFQLLQLPARSAILAPRAIVIPALRAMGLQQYAPAMPASLGCWTVLAVSIVSTQYISAFYISLNLFFQALGFADHTRLIYSVSRLEGRTARTEGHNYHFLSGDLPLDFGSFTVMVLQKHHLFTIQSEIFVCRICFLVITLAGEQRVEYKNKNE